MAARAGRRSALGAAEPRECRLVDAFRGRDAGRHTRRGAAGTGRTSGASHHLELIGRTLGLLDLGSAAAEALDRLLFASPPRADPNLTRCSCSPCPTRWKPQFGRTGSSEVTGHLDRFRPGYSRSPTPRASALLSRCRALVEDSDAKTTLRRRRSNSRRSCRRLTGHGPSFLRRVAAATAPTR